MRVKKKIEQVSYMIVSGLFVDMCNKKNQSKNFTWEKFPDLSAKYVSGKVEVHFKNYLKMDKNMKEQIYNYTKSIAEDFVKRAGFV